MPPSSLLVEHVASTYPALRCGAVRVVKGRHAGKVGYDADDESDRTVRLPREPIHSGRVLIRRDDLANVTSLEHERWTRAHPEFCRRMGIR